MDRQDIQGGPAKVRPTYNFAGNIILVTCECLGKIQWFFGKYDKGLDTHLGKRKNLIFNIVRQMATEFYLRIQMLPAKLASL